MTDLTEEEITVLNAARTVLDNHGRLLSLLETPAEARVSAAAEIAELAIFKFLNWTHAYLHVEMSEEQLHNREEVPA